MGVTYGISIDGPNSGEAPARSLPARIVEFDSPRFRASADDARRTGAARAVVRSTQWRHDDEARDCVRPLRLSASLAFTAQFIAQEVLGDGLYIEDFRPAVKAYAAAETDFGHEPSAQRTEIWA